MKTHQQFEPFIIQHMKEDHQGSDGQFAHANQALPPAVPEESQSIVLTSVLSQTQLGLLEASYCTG